MMEEEVSRLLEFLGLEKAGSFVEPHGFLRIILEISPDLCQPRPLVPHKKEEMPHLFGRYLLCSNTVVMHTANFALCNTLKRLCNAPQYFE